MAHRFNRPATRKAAQRSVSIKVRKPPDQALTAVHIGKMVDYKFECKGIDSNIYTDAAHLRCAPPIAQENMLLPVDRFQKRLSAPNIGQ